MKKIKWLSAILALTVLSGCASSAPSESAERIVWNYGNADERGELYTDSGERLNFVDFDTMQSALLCSKPNCTHANAKECSAFGMSNHPILYGDKLYFFDVETNFDGDEVTDTTTVYKADPDGTNRVKACEIEGLSLLTYTRMLIVGDRAYFSMDKTGWNEEQTASSGYNEVWFCGFDFSTDTFEKIEMLHEGWCSSSWIFGLYDNKVVFRYAYSEEKVPYLENANDIGKYLTNVYKAYDTENGVMSELTLPEPLCVGGGYYVYEKDGGAVALSESGKEMPLPDFSAGANLTITNGKLFNCSEQVCADLSNGKMYKLNSPDNLVVYSDGNYILKSFNGLKQAYEYSKTPEKDYIGGAL
ncbi:MAG: lipoprotein [Lachnospiraceae bacterium]|nr:lipoprotein [Ruminococcus sp.]MCM1276856.1 lipoprotein [Lachnospiraceae bacterium]